MNWKEIFKRAQGSRTQTAWAKELNTTSSVISNINSRRRQPGRKLIEALLEHPDGRRELLAFILSKNATIEREVVTHEK